MARNRYDDWNFMGESLDTSSRSSSVERVSHITVLFVIACVILLVLGLVCAYSASYPEALENGYSNFHYIKRQLMFVGIGLAAGIAAIAVPDGFFRAITPVYMFASFLILGINIFVKNNYITYESIFGLMVLAVVMYLSLYFANRDNYISRLRELMFPTLFCVIFVFLIAVQQDVTYLILFLAVVIMMFAVGGVGPGGVILLVLYSLVPAALWVLSDPDKLTFLLNQIVPGLDSSNAGTQAVLRQQSFASGGWLGKGIGMGHFKSAGIEGISREFILCNVSEELGFAGLCAIAILFMIIAYTGYRCSYYTRKYNTHYSNLSAGLTTIVVWQFVLNVLSVLGIGFFRGISLPFFSLGSDVAVIILYCCIILRCMLRGLGPKKEETAADIIALAESEEDRSTPGLIYDTLED